MTIQELFKQMTAEEIAYFCTNVSNSNKGIFDFFTSEYEDIYEWVVCAFNWENSPEGADYWSGIAFRTTANNI